MFSRKVMLIAEAQRYAFLLVLLLEELQTQEGTCRQQRMVEDANILLTQIQEEVRALQL